jgi:hypothetical protein
MDSSTGRRAISVTSHQIDWLRDLAIQHLPRAQADRNQSSRFGLTEDMLYAKLYVTCVMVRGKAGVPVLEATAAEVLESVAILRRPEPIEAGERAALLRRLMERGAALRKLTGTMTLDAGDEEHEPVPVPVAEPSHGVAPVAASSIAGRHLTTKEAAAYLHVAEQTMRAWASQDRGPIRPSRAGRKLLWSGDELLAHLAK